MFSEIGKLIGGVVGFATGSILGVSSVIISSTLGITIDMVEEALKSGCSTYEDIRRFHKLD